jgi:uncharacterized protein (DUF2062 family)
MPSRRVHELFDLLFLGKRYSKVHRTLDAPSKVLGSSHRSLLHDPMSAMLIGAILTGDIGGALSALLHIWVDRNAARILKSSAHRTNPR